MRTARARFVLLASCLLFLPVAALGGAAEPAPEDREVPPDRGHLFLLDKDFKQVLARFNDPGTPLEKRVEIAGVFALTEDSRAVPDLVKLVRNPRESMALKAAALWALGEIGSPAGMVAFQYALSQIYLDKPEWRYDKGVTVEVDGKETAISLRELCESRLGRLAEPVVSKLADLLFEPIQRGSSEPGPEATQENERTGRMRAALVSLAAVGDRDPRAVQALTGVLRADDKYYPWDFKVIASEALRALVEQRAAELKGLQAKDKMVDQIAAAFVEAAVITESPDVRELAGVTLRKIGWADEAARRLVAVLQTPNLPKAPLYHAIEALAFIRSKAAADQLIFMLYDPDSNVRWRAAIALGATGDTRALNFLRKLSNDKDYHVREKAIAALGHLEDPLAIPDIAVAIDDPDFRVRRQAALALGRLGRREAIPALVKKGLKDRSPSVRGMSVIALGYIGRSEGLKSVPAMLADPDAGVRLVAVQVLSRFLNPGATRALIAGLGDTDASVRDAAAKAVPDRIERQPKETVGLLVEAVAEGKGEARLAALTCLDADYRKLRNAKDPKRLVLYDKLLASPSDPLAAALVACLADEKPQTRAIAASFLVDYGWSHKNKELIQRVAALGSDPDRGVRQAALKATNYLRNLP